MYGIKGGGGEEEKKDKKKKRLHWCFNGILHTHTQFEALCFTLQHHLGGGFSYHFSTVDCSLSHAAET